MSEGESDDDESEAASETALDAVLDEASDNSAEEASDEDSDGASVVVTSSSFFLASVGARKKRIASGSTETISPGASRVLAFECYP